MNFPQNLQYAKSHEWLKTDGATATVGITDFAQDALGDIVFINLPEVGDTVEAGGIFADLESVKAVSDLYSPVTGTVVAVNEALLDAPENINAAPYDAWFVEIGDITDSAELMDSEAYAAHCENEAH